MRHHSCGAQKQGNKQNKQTAPCSPSVTTKAKPSSVLQYADHHLASLTGMQSFHLTWQLRQLAVEALPGFALQSLLALCPSSQTAVKQKGLKLQKSLCPSPPPKKNPKPKTKPHSALTPSFLAVRTDHCDFPRQPTESSHKTQRHTSSNNRETAPKGKGPS